ncbi:MAG: tetratricopeptide repeat protein [Bacteroidaceae bacterium]|nr:tetratricopeptide repeat protein [Bacteroidaceae bacterium]
MSRIRRAGSKAVCFSFFIIHFSLFLLFSAGAKGQINTDHMMMVGRNALYFKDYVLSIQYFNQVINAKPYLYEPYFFRGLAKFYLDDFGGAESDCTQAIDRNPFVADCYQVRALSRMRQGNFDGAISDYRDAARLDPENEGIWHNLALCYGHTERFDEAIGVLDTLHRIAPKYTPALTIRAQVNIQRRDTVAAYADIAESMKVDKYNAAAYSMRAILYMQQERYAEAEDDLTYAIHLIPSSNDYINRALARYHQQNLRGAMSDYDIAIDMDANSFLGHYNRGLLRAQVGDNNRAIEDFDFVISREPDNTIAIFNRALLRMQTGDYEGAESDFTAVLTEYPKFLYGYECRAEVRDRLGRRKLAEEDRIVLLKAQLASWGRGDTRQDDDEKDEGEDSDVRRKSDRNVKKYKRLVIADDELALEGNEYASEYRGKVQNRNIHVEMLPLYVATCYEQSSGLPRSVAYHHDLDALNRNGGLPRPLIVTSSESPLTEEQIAFHFADINEQTRLVTQLAAGDGEEDGIASIALQTAVHWFARGLDFYLVQDLISAIADYSSAIAADGSLWVAYFNRAVARYKQAQIEGRSNEAQELMSATGTADNTPVGTEYTFYQLCLADFGKVIDLAPDFAYAWYNRANIHAMMHDYNAAIADYNEVIAMNPSFAEAYYNRGLARLFLGQNEQGTRDLSKAGELGLYGAYNLIKRFGD